MKIKSLEQVSFDERTNVVEWHGNELEIKWALSIKEMMDFVRFVVSGCFDEDLVEYYPEYRDLLIKVSTLALYADIDVPEGDWGRAYECIYKTNLYKTILDNINRYQYEQIISAIDDKIENILSTNISIGASQIKELFKSFENMQDQFGGLFKDINPDDVANIAKAISNGDFSEEKIVRAVMDYRTDNITKEE